MIFMEKKYIAVAGLGTAITAIGIGLLLHSKKEEKHGLFK
jgi:hypothetical protein